MSIRDQLAEAVSSALATMAASEGSTGDSLAVSPESVHLERPGRREHGDWSTNVAMANAKSVGRPPRELAESLIEVLSADLPPHVERVEIAGPGFINFHLDAGWLHDALIEIVTEGEAGYARPDVGHGERVQVEFISANPTGPIHVGNGWWGSYGDALARVLDRAGYEVSREYYVNDTGGQIRRLGESLLARYHGTEVPDEGYQGEYVSGVGGFLRRSRRCDCCRAVGRRSDSRQYQARRWNRSTSSSTSGIARPRSKRAARWRKPSPFWPRRDWCSSRTGPPGYEPPSWATTATGFW